ncbi:MAG: Holliday junction branch migration protein RuvA [Oscillospiraceae bacterium]|nr:Holliday junction branch migration protein RuvA [Oscillospiraceae bacterium]
MFYYLNGKITVLEAGLAVVDCAGVGYACHCSSYTQSQLRVGEEHRLYTHVNVKEDAFDIYGFSGREELRLFELLTAVTGIGPASALAIQSVLSPDQLTLAILTGDEKSITRAKGVGAKSAKRIILELKDKIGGELDFSAGVGGAAPAAVRQDGGKLALATAALAELGYSQSEAAAALKGADAEKLSVEELVRYGLRAMVSARL